MKFELIPTSAPNTDPLSVSLFIRLSLYLTGERACGMEKSGYNLENNKKIIPRRSDSAAERRCATWGSRDSEGKKRSKVNKLDFFAPWRIRVSQFRYKPHGSLKNNKLMDWTMDATNGWLWISKTRSIYLAPNYTNSKDQRSTSKDKKSTSNCSVVTGYYKLQTPKIKLQRATSKDQRSTSKCSVVTGTSSCAAVVKKPVR